MAKKRDLKLKNYITKQKYLELKHFCLQYHEKKKEISYGLRSTKSDGGCSGEIGKPTERQAIRNAILKRDVEMIEQTALEADPGIYPWLLKNVTEGIPYEYLDVPMSRTKFYDARRYFFYLLAQKR